MYLSIRPSFSKTAAEIQSRIKTLSFWNFWLPNVLRATTACNFSTSWNPKVVRACSVLYVLNWKRASRHNCVHFFHISTYNSGLRMRCFVDFGFEMCFAPRLNFQKWSIPAVFCTFWLGNVLRATTACIFFASHFDLEMCFAPQRLAIFLHLNVQNCAEPVSFWHFLLGNELRATTGCNCSSFIWPAGSAPVALASVHFDPLEPQIIGKTQCFVTFLPFRAPSSCFFWLSLTFPSLIFFFLLLATWFLWDLQQRCCMKPSNEQRGRTTDPFPVAKNLPASAKVTFFEFGEWMRMVFLFIAFGEFWA